jgi:WD40 repeat protein
MKLRFTGHSRPVLAMAAMNRSDQVITAGADHTIRIWNILDGTVVRTMDNHTSVVNDLAVQQTPTAAATGNLASVGEDRTVRIWQSETGRLVRSMRLESVPGRVVWTENNHSLLVGCNDGTVREIVVEDWKVGRSWRAKYRLFELSLLGSKALLVGGPMGLERISID